MLCPILSARQVPLLLSDPELAGLAAVPAWSLVLSAQQFQQIWSAAGGIQVGPFQIGGSSGGSSLNRTQSASGMTLTVTSTSLMPLIFGVNIAIQPQ